MSGNSPKLRIQRLKKEIEDLDQQIKLNPAKKILNLPLHAVLNVPNAEREEMQLKINSMRVSATSKEQTLHTQLKGIQQNLRASALKKQNELGSSKSYRESLKKRMDELKINLQKYNDDYVMVSTSLEEKKRMIENSSVAKAKVYNESLIPLENDSKMLEILKIDLETKLLKLQDEESTIKNRIKMCKEEWENKYTLKTELIGMREEVEGKLEVFSKEFHDEIEFFKDEDEFFRKVLHLNNLQNKYKEEVCKLEASLNLSLIGSDRINSRLTQLNKEIQALILDSGELKISAEIAKLEQSIKNKCESLGIESFENLILELNTLEGFDVDEEILKLQLQEIKMIETQLRQQFEFEEKSFSESLIIKNYEKKSTDSLEDSFHIKKVVFRNKMAAISQWKEEVESVMFNYSPKIEVSIQDKTIIQEFFVSLGRLGPEARKELENLINSYVSKVTNRDKSIRTQAQLLKEKHSEKNRLKDKVNRVNSEIYRAQLDILRAKQQVQVLVEKKNILLNEYKSGSSNSIIRELLCLKSEITYFDNCYLIYSKSTEILLQILNDLQDSLKYLKREINLCKLSQSEASDDLKTLQYQIEKINDKKTKNFPVPGRSLDDEKLLMLKTKIEETASELNNCQTEFNNFESEYQLKLSMIEQEESMLRSQQQAIESALRNIEIDSKRIQDLEMQMVRFEDADAPNPEMLKDQNRSKSAAKMRRGLKMEDLYTNEIRDDNEESSIAEGNQYLELVVKPLGRNIPIVTERNVQPRTINKKYYRFNLEDISQNEISFLEKIRPLLEGSEILKKFVSKSKIKNFDILDSLNLMPEQCGYAARHFFLHKSLSKIEVKQPLKPGFESTIVSENLWGPVLPPNVILVLKAQGYLNYDDLDYDKLNDKAKDSVNFDVNSERFKELCKGICYYPFSIGLLQGDKIDLVAKGYQTLKQWVNGINALTKYKRYIPKLRSRIEAYTTC